MSESTLLTTLDARATVSLKEVAQRLGMPEQAVRRLANAGKIPGAFKPFGAAGRWRFKRSELETWYARLDAGRNVVNAKPAKAKGK
jgi:excisionase family DNA binding protein